MNWTDEQRAAIETLVARDGCCTVSTDDVSDLTERIGWNTPEPLDRESEKRLAGQLWHELAHQKAMLHMHLKAVLESDPFEAASEKCHWCECYIGDAHHDDDCPWALARAYLDSLEAK